MTIPTENREASPNLHRLSYQVLKCENSRGYFSSPLERWTFFSNITVNAELCQIALCVYYHACVFSGEGGARGSQDHFVASILSTHLCMSSRDPD